ncbi:hypothetical protein FO519_010808 [Halicephalobus sp. NKZ332]|nr:hypothetical protein FO519_010808 [Halicephalobus sp. NKZ332]
MHEEVVESPRPIQKEESGGERRSEERKHENVSKSDFEDNDKAIYTSFFHRFVPDSKIKGTVFETFTNSSDLIDRIDLSEVASFIESNNSRLLNSEQIEMVSNVRKQLPKKDFEIMFALYK